MNSTKFSLLQDRCDLFLKMLGDCTPFALARFNDGEMAGVEKVGAVVARGEQRS